MTVLQEPPEPDSAGDGEAAVALTPLTLPRDGVPDVVVDERALSRAADDIAGGTGPIAIDADSNAAFVLTTTDGRDALYKVRLTAPRRAS